MSSDSADSVPDAVMFAGLCTGEMRTVDRQAPAWSTVVKHKTQTSVHGQHYPSSLGGVNQPETHTMLRVIMGKHQLNSLCDPLSV